MPIEINKCKCCDNIKRNDNNTLCQHCYKEIDDAETYYDYDMFLQSQCGHDLWLLGGNDYDV